MLTNAAFGYRKDVNIQNFPYQLRRKTTIGKKKIVQLEGQNVAWLVEFLLSMHEALRSKPTLHKIKCHVICQYS